MARTKKLTDPIYSPTNPTSEAAIRAQIDDSIQEVYDQSAKATDTVNLTGNQTIADVKTFSSSPIVPIPTTSTQVANKAYVDGVAISATIPLDSLTDDYLASAPGNIKPRFSNFEADFEYPVATVVSRQIRITKLGTNKVSRFQLSATIASGAGITISLDGGATSLPLRDIDNVAISQLDKGLYEVIADATFFTLRPSGIKFLGDAVVANVLAGKTFYSNDKTLKTGTMVDRAGDTAALSQTRTGTTIKLRASEGYRDGTNDFVTHADANDIAANIKAGVTIRGLTGTLKERALLDDFVRNYNSASYSTITFVQGEGLWVKQSNNQAFLMNSAGTIINTVTYTADSNARPFFIDDSIIMWYLNGLSVLITDKSGTLLRTLTGFSNVSTTSSVGNYHFVWDPNVNRMFQFNAGTLISNNIIISGGNSNGLFIANSTNGVFCTPRVANATTTYVYAGSTTTKTVDLQVAIANVLG